MGVRSFKGGESIRKNPSQRKKFICTIFSEQFLAGLLAHVTEKQAEVRTNFLKKFVYMRCFSWYFWILGRIFALYSWNSMEQGTSWSLESPSAKVAIPDKMIHPCRKDFQSSKYRHLHVIHVGRYASCNTVHKITCKHVLELMIVKFRCGLHT